jgi:beta-barrel assembly-enhancing protease
MRLRPGISLTALLVAALLAQSCASNVNAVCSGETEKALSVRDKIERELPLRSDDVVTSYVRAFGVHLSEQAGIAGKANWRFAVVRDRSVNAFSIGDGRIYVTEGAILSAHNQDEFAGVIAHEMGHQIGGHFCPQVQAYGGSSVGHGSQGVSAQLGSLRQGMDPTKEREADEFAVRILLDAGYDPAARSRVINRSSAPIVENRRPQPVVVQRQGASPTGRPSALARAQEALRLEW